MWDYLDKMNHNLLYKYAAVLSGKKRHFYNTDSEKDASVNAEEKKKNVCYLIWFVYRYILQCRTLEETLPYQNEEILRKYKLFWLIKHEAVFICNDEICLRKPEDIAVILEILYGRYTLWEQFDCFIRNTTGIRQKRCIKAKEKYWNMYQEYLKNEEKKRKENEEDEVFFKEMFRSYGSVI